MFKSKDNKAEDDLLLQQIKANSMLAFDALYDKYWEQVYSAAYKRLKDADYAKDITQDIFLQIWQKREEINIDHFAPYLFTAVRNNVFKWMQKEQRFTPIPDLLAHLSATKDNADAEVLRKEFMLKYEALIETLTPAQQEIFRMRFHEDLSTKEIAEKLNITRKTVQNQLGKSVNQLRGSLDLLYFVMMLHVYN
ncbi:MAG: RNA polymerase sigma-70 factor [Bacteroidota bacterium]|uniref:RNA polymerase sigma-70 factor n=1 Tax=Pedobacter cryotolerans TaxID=2571270 RepID=A0A4U1C1Y1_9SPHI|nr:RNA polymerase sigma-70 factor [Pedobacter cryotolerans]TKB99682.1 RNA polymerase sigma-70 factor [Pedobacter cryotolerans]